MWGLTRAPELDAIQSTACQETHSAPVVGVGDTESIVGLPFEPDVLVLGPPLPRLKNFWMSIRGSKS